MQCKDHVRGAGGFSYSQCPNPALEGDEYCGVHAKPKGTGKFLYFARYGFRDVKIQRVEIGKETPKQYVMMGSFGPNCLTRVPKGENWYSFSRADALEMAIARKLDEIAKAEEKTERLRKELAELQAAPPETEE